MTKENGRSWLRARGAFALAFLALLPVSVVGLIPEPDHVFYGVATAYGAPVSAGTVTAVIEGQAVPVATFALSPASTAYQLRLPMDSVDPQSAGTARPGNTVKFYVNGNLAGMAVVGERGTATPLNLDRNFDDSVSILGASIPEGDSGIVEVDLTVKLSEASGVPVTVEYQTVAGGTATPGVDFVAVAATTITFPAGVTTTTVKISVKGDVLNEADETVFVDLGNPDPNLRLGSDSRGIVSIVNDDAAAVVSSSDVTRAEGMPGAGTTVNFPVTLSKAIGQPAAVSYATANGTARAGSDYSATAGVVTFAPGATSAVVSVPLMGDRLYEPTETFTLQLSAPVNVVLAASSVTGTIADDDQRGTDLNGDGMTDLIWHNETDGRLVAWFMNGLERSDVVPFEPPGYGDVNWKIVGTADFDLDGSIDLLWRHPVTGELAVWLMDGMTLERGVILPNDVKDPAWLVEATGDFNSDGKSDFLWRNANDGSLRAWLMDGVARTDEVDISPPSISEPGWEIAGTGDFNADQKSDILWQKDDGSLQVWYMNGTSRGNDEWANLVPARTADPDSRVAAIADFNGDGTADILFRHARTGRFLVWLMDGKSRVSVQAPRPPGVDDFTWRLVGPR